jgi:hypothetical protein
MNNKLLAPLAAALAIVIGVGAFYAGGWYQGQQRLSRFRAMANGGQGFPGGGQGPMGGQGRGSQGFGAPGGQGDPRGMAGRQRILSARVDAMEDGEITLTTQFGSVTVKLDKKTDFKRTAAAKKTDIEKGSEVLIESEPDDDGGLTAKTVTLK